MRAVLRFLVVTPMLGGCGSGNGSGGGDGGPEGGASCPEPVAVIDDDEPPG
jgi:hypothetical protein